MYSFGLLGIAPRPYPPRGQILLLYYSPFQTVRKLKILPFVILNEARLNFAKQNLGGRSEESQCLWVLWGVEIFRLRPVRNFLTLGNFNNILLLKFLTGLRLKITVLGQPEFISVWKVF